MEKRTKLGHRKGSGIAGNPVGVGVGMFVGGVQCWLVLASVHTAQCLWFWCVVIGVGGTCQSAQ